MYDSVFEIDKIAVMHYRYRLDVLIGRKENIEIKPLLEEELKQKIELLDEIIDCHNQNNEKQRKEQWDRYKIPICKALLLFREDLQKCSQSISQFGSENVKLSIRTTNESIKRIDVRLNSFSDTIADLERSSDYGYSI